MHLKRIELAGFKSFVDPTRLELGSGITCIVGPNGCGKSNIIDAVRWVLGEHSARHLRGAVMDDLIFQGSDTRPPVSVCDVELTFAVNPGELPSPWHELDEISIRRRLTRDGGSDAFINGKPVRIKDVVDLFLDTGISTRAYAIVEQGQIARMITAKPEERRAIFEEAAGVMKYRSRRREAERRMQDTTQNLERVVDLLEEVRSQCRSLKQQASRAERFKQMQDEFTRLQSLSLGLRYQELQLHVDAAQKRLQQSRTEEAEASSLVAAAEKNLAEIRDAWVQHEHRIQQAQDELRQAEQQQARLQQEGERLAGERRLLEERKQTLQGRIEETRLRLRQLETEHERRQKELAAYDDSPLLLQRQDALARVEAAEIALRQASSRRDASLSAFERLRHGRDQARQQKEKAQDTITRLEERLRHVRVQIEEVEQELRQQQQQAIQAEAACKQASQKRDEAEKRRIEAEQQLDVRRHERERAAADLTEAEAHLRALSGTLEELRGRTHSTDIPNDLREALRRKGGIWIDETLQVPPGLEAAVAAALRGRYADVRLTANPGLKDIEDMLDEISRVPMALFAGGHQTQPVDSSLADAIGLEKDHPLYDVFAGVRLLDRISDATHAEICCVSRDGWRMEPDGWLVPPADSPTASMLTLQQKIRATEHEVGRASETVEQRRQHLADAQAALKEAELVWQQAHLEAAQAESAAHSAVAAVERWRKERESLDARRERLQHEENDVQQELEHWHQQIHAMVPVDEAALEQAKARLDEHSRLVQAAEQTWQQAREQLAQVDQALALSAQSQRNVESECERLAGEREHLQKRCLEDEQRLSQIVEEITAAEDVHDLDERLKQASETVVQAQRAVQRIRERGHELQGQVHQAEKEERIKRQSLQQASEQRQRTELEVAQGRTRLQDLEEEIRHRCQRPLRQVLQELDALDEDSDPASILARAQELEARLTRFGAVNLLAIEEYEQAAEREAFLAEQAADLQKSLETLQQTIGRIDRTMRQRFRDVFEQTNAIFKQTFPQLFGGGRAELRLDSDDILSAGVEVTAQPPGKRLQDIGLLSGGEKALTAVALVFSIFRIKPAPFCILDEVDAPLDDANVGRFCDLVRQLADQVQFLAITHNKVTMQQADRLIGVSMPEAGVSRIVSVDLQSVPA